MTTKIDKNNSENQSLTADIGRRFKQERKRLHLKATDFDQYGVWPASTIYGWEAGKASPKSEFYALAQRLGFDVLYVLTGQRAAGSPQVSEPAPTAGPPGNLAARLVEAGLVANGIALALALDVINPAHVHTYAERLKLLAPAVGASDTLAQHLLQCVGEGVDGFLANR